MISSIVTKTGDRGTTGLYGGERLPKHAPRIEAYGTVDELNAAIGVAIACPNVPDVMTAQLLKIQHTLFRVGGDLATPLTKKEKQERVGAQHVSELEEWITALESTLPQQQRFILPGGSPAGSHLHYSRTVCRRAERRVTALAEIEEINPQVVIYLNRLSDYLFVAAREANRVSGMGDVEVRY